MDSPSNPPAPLQSSSPKERFDLCIGMLKAYYDALEGRLEKSVALLVVIIGWLVTSDKARAALAEEPTFFWTALVALTVIVAMYCWNIVHWVRRFREVQVTADELNFVEHRYYTRYRFPRGVAVTYLMPVVLLYVFAVICLLLIKSGALTPPDTNRSPAAETSPPTLTLCGIMRKGNFDARCVHSRSPKADDRIDAHRAERRNDRGRKATIASTTHPRRTSPDP